MFIYLRKWFLFELLAQLFSIFLLTLTLTAVRIHHPFVLSDNRHYVFYIWKRILFRHPAVSYLLAPVYLACWWAWWIRVGKSSFFRFWQLQRNEPWLNLSLGATQSLLQTLILPLSLIPTLVPSPLLEPRYFIVPYILLRLQVPPYDPGEAPIPPSWQEEINKSRGKSAKTDPKTHPRQKDLGPATPAATAKTPVAGLDWANVLPWVELVWYGLINYATMYVFLYKQRGEGESVIRFMWWGRGRLVSGWQFAPRFCECSSRYI